MIQIINGLLSELELNILKKECDNFNEDLFQIYSVQNKKNLIHTSLNNYISNVTSYINKIDANFILDDIWINKIVENTNLDEKFHFDDADFSIVTYLNRDYIGGDLEWVDNNQIQKITPQENTADIYYVNSEHILCLCDNNGNYINGLFVKVINFTDIFANVHFCLKHVVKVLI